MKQKQNSHQKFKPAFTLVEVLVATTIFVILGMLSLTVFINVTRTQARSNLEFALNEDSRFIMAKIRNEISENAIDYEEYFNKNFNNQYGKIHGCYAAQFYNPGYKSTGLVDSIGNLCGGDYQDQSTITYPTCTVYKPSQDINTGQNPFEGRTGFTTTSNSAFCADKVAPYASSTLACTSLTQNNQSALYLINSTGAEKTIFARRATRTLPSGKPEYGIGIIRINGEDTNNDSVYDKFTGCTGNTFCCKTGFNCTLNGADTLETTLTSYTSTADNKKGFVSISPERSTITYLNFLITPTEDPEKAFKETTSNQTPSIKVIFTLRPSELYVQSSGYDQSNVPEFTYQSEFTPGVTTEVNTFTGALPAGCPY